MKQTAFTRFLNWVLVVLGFTVASCEDPHKHAPMYGTPPPVMYGQPHMSYEISGKVVDEENNPIKGIEILGEYAGAIYTDVDGLFKISVEKGGAPVAFFKDIDGPENGGEFLQKREDFDWSTFEQVEEADKANWYLGKFIGKDQVVTLKKKK